ncbi:rhodanese-related sulfurtransferase [Bartonella sp. DGB2]|uniref:oxygen-dependent tRNA uridine(34) hydroxylase TrhO n=1 Tax=Bartonella sp. DGB2 TaxID=3388426 RepID=UPI00398FAC48
MNETYTVAALYCFARFTRYKQLQAPLRALCQAAGIKGTLLLAREGINGTVAGKAEDIACLVAFITEQPELAAPEIKYSYASKMPFRRMKVRLKQEIVTMGVEEVDPLQAAGTYVPPQDWNALIQDPETIVIDTRNDYECAIGTFAGAIDPHIKTFRAFPRWVQENLALLKQKKKIAMFCTGGIRCEKSTAYVRGLGFDQVYHLKGGVLKYLEDIPKAQSLWNGECFVFDERVAVGHGLSESALQLCRACRRPLGLEDHHHPNYEEGVSCAGCYHEHGEDDRARFRERHKQVQLAKSRGVAPHIGYS